MPTLSPAEMNELFGVDALCEAATLAPGHPDVPPKDESFAFSEEATQAILEGFNSQRWVLLHGPPGVGKSSHVEQVAARLNWPTLRINLDGHLTRADLVGRDQVRVEDGVPTTAFCPGLMVWALTRPVAVILDEYDAGRPDVMFVLQQVLEQGGKLTLLEENKVLTPHPQFRLFATANTVGGGDISGMYSGTQLLNQAQLDRWPIVVEMAYLPAEQESQLLTRKVAGLDPQLAQRMVSLAGFIRKAHAQGDLAVQCSLRTLLAWAESTVNTGKPELGFMWAYGHRCESPDRVLVRELYQRCMGRELS